MYRFQLHPRSATAILWKSTQQPPPSTSAHTTEEEIMDDRRIDVLARQLASGTTRRGMLKGLLGLGGLVATGAVAFDQVDAARRGYPGPSIVTPPPLAPTPTPRPCAQRGGTCLLPSMCCSGICREGGMFGFGICA
jgi:hypothetical protein